MHTDTTSLTQSYVHGASRTPLLGETIGAHLDRMASLSPDRPALIVRHQTIRWTYAEFKRTVDRVAAGLVALGLKPGESDAMRSRCAPMVSPSSGVRLAP